MNNLPITNHSQLLLRIAELKAIKDIEEEELKISIRKFISTIDLVSFFKVGILNSGSHTADLVKTGINMVLNLLISVIVGKHRSMKGFLSSILIEKFTSTLINNNLMGIIAAISSLLSRKNETEASPD
jgi:hypothetical protein